MGTSRRVTVRIVVDSKESSLALSIDAAMICSCQRRCLSGRAHTGGTCQQVENHFPLTAVRRAAAARSVPAMRTVYFGSLGRATGLEPGLPCSAEAYIHTLIACKVTLLEFYVVLGGRRSRAAGSGVLAWATAGWPSSPGIPPDRPCRVRGRCLNVCTPRRVRVGCRPLR